MSDIILRPCRESDFLGITELWCRTFGDVKAVPEYFLSRIDELGKGFTASADGVIVGCAFALTDFTLHDKGEKKLGYIYAVAVDEAFRHRGIGAKLTQMAAEYISSVGAILTVRPAESSLFGWYERILGVKCAIYREEKLIAARNACAVYEISGEEYFRLRAGLVKEPYVSLGCALQDYQCRLIETYGGFYSFRNGIAAVSDGVVREMIGGRAKECAALAYAQKLENVTAFFPAEEGEMYVAALPGTVDEKTFWNFTLD